MNFKMDYGRVHLYLDREPAPRGGKKKWWVARRWSGDRFAWGPTRSGVIRAVLSYWPNAVFNREAK